MSTTLRIFGFLAVLVAVFALALGIGRAVGPTGDETAAHHGDEDSTGEGMEEESDGSTGGTAVVDLPGGLMVSQAGYTLRLNQQQARPGRAVAVSFAIEGPDGQRVTTYDVEQEKRLHLIAVRRDMRGFQHVHPVLSADGAWSTTLDLIPGQWRLFADFKATGADPVTLGADLAVAGAYRPFGDRGESRMAMVDGYEVSVDGELVPGTDSQLTMTVAKNGEPVTDLQPYLGAYGHVVALRDGDLAYLHVHPDGTPGDGVTDPGPSMVFYASVPSTGRYHLFLNFQHGDVVRTAPFVLDTGAAAAQPINLTPPKGPPSEGSHAGH